MTRIRQKYGNQQSVFDSIVVVIVFIVVLYVVKDELFCLNGWMAVSDSEVQ